MKGGNPLSVSRSETEKRVEGITTSVRPPESSPDHHDLPASAGRKGRGGVFVVDLVRLWSTGAADGLLVNEDQRERVELWG
ncbi:hypothetical protein HAX54_001579, partial [Datura stramonium]|nr:hypothetical protein [Datura stramonium]